MALNPTISASVIGAVATIIGVLLTNYLNTRQLDAKYEPLPDERVAALTGLWSGTESQYSGLKRDQPAEMKATLDITVSGKRIGGEYFVRWEGPPAREAVFLIEGGFLDNRFLQLDYVSRDPKKSYFGSLLLILSPEGNDLDGHVVGYSGIANAIGASTLSLERSR